MVFHNITPAAPPASVALGPELESYTYQPLEPGRHIRLLSIRSDAADGSLRFQLVRHQIDDAPLYQTLSYTWGFGARDLALPVLSEGCIFQSLPITQNLHKALPFLAKECNTGFIWIDQICINQEDIQERSSQVAIMADIYSNASSCLVWLGEATDFSQLILMNLRICALPSTGDYKVQDAEWTKADSIESYRQPLTVRKEIKAWMQDFPSGYEVATKAVIVAVIELMSFTWFTLVWILQEVKRSKKVYMLIGSDVWAPCQLFQLVTAVDSIIRGDRVYEYSLWDSSPGWRVFDFIANFQDHDSFQRTFYGILASMRHLKIKGRLQATDPRDFIYGILGFCDDIDKVRLTPDYELDVAMVYIQATRRMLAHEAALDVLLISEGISRSDQDKDHDQVPHLPSWVPVWSTAYPGHPLLTLRSRRGVGELSHAFRASAGRPYIPYLEHRPQELTVRGQTVGIVGTAYKSEHVQFLIACYNAALFPKAYPVPFAVCLARLRYSMEGRDEDRMEQRLIRLFVSADRNNQYQSHFQTYAEYQRPTFSKHVDEVYQIYHRHREAAPARSAESVQSSSAEPLKSLADSEHDFIAWLKQQRSLTNDLREQGCQLCAQDEHGILTQQISDAVRQPLIEHLFMTSNGTFGGSNQPMESGDFICILHGHDFPVILRQVDHDRYQYVGSCVLEKGMFGELVDWEEDKADTSILV